MSNPDLDSVRAELRRLGYLSHGVGRFLLQDALRPRAPRRAFAALTLKVAGLAGPPVALVLAFALAGANGALAARPLDVVPLVGHLLVPAAVIAGGAFVALGALAFAILRVRPARGVEGLSLALALAACAGAAVVAVWRGRDLLAASPPWAWAVVASAGPLLVYSLVRVYYEGLLALAILATALPPRGAFFARRGVVLGATTAVVLLALPLALAARPRRPAPAAVLPAAPGTRVLLLGLDGVLPQEFDYLLARGDLPGLRRLLETGGWVAAYEREALAPATFWTTVATGRAGSEHGVAALDSFLPLGLETPLARSGWLRAYWQRVELPLGLAEYRPVLANRRGAYAFWELAARGGVPVAAVNWWATFPVEPLPGLVVAHGAYQLLEEGAAQVVAPASELRAVEELRRAATAEPAGDEVRAALPPAAAAAVRARALVPDRFYREVLAVELERAPRAAALYLPGLDLAAADWGGGDVALADLVRQELERADALVAAAAPGLGAIAVVLDPGRRGGGEGRVLLWRAAGCAAPPARLDPRQVAAALLRDLGLPQSEQLPEPPGDCGWPEPPARVAAYPERRAAGAARPVGEEYLRSLRALGYL